MGLGFRVWSLGLVPNDYESPLLFCFRSRIGSSPSRNFSLPYFMNIIISIVILTIVLITTNTKTVTLSSYWFFKKPFFGGYLFIRDGIAFALMGS